MEKNKTELNEKEKEKTDEADNSEDS